jgi:HEPN domain-containing protein
MNKKEQLIAEWIKKAENDLAIVKVAIEHQPDISDIICFHCQQASEKYLKAYLVHLDIIFKKTHSLDYLIDLISDVDTDSADLYPMAEILEDYGVEVRYPGDWEPSATDVEEAFQASNIIKEYVTKRL